MNNMVVKILELFKHISRDIMIYVIPGFIIVVNLFIIDELYLNNKILGLIEKLEYLSFIIFLPLIIGISLLILHYVTEKEYKEKVNTIKTLYP
ncbi:hypothetical protein PJV95_10070 [Aliarcobacter butzleri]|jgi:hypothetical protein|uniref:hypothetical protein n=1 Tax=Aliarcobacter butzleri TaxID=28197 RepID=UPI001261259A|nr:hypothetical protein [Aliarcobacter butzleri]MDN5126583.1 hypothetical protein [Aliarcobacter butzleri]